jgi:hypothetical protein
LNGCMSADVTWDEFHVCLSQCLLGAPDAGVDVQALENCMSDNCSAQCPN